MRRLLASAIAALLLVAPVWGQIASSYPAGQTPSYASAGAGLMYATTCDAVVNNSTPTSTFCPVATDASSAAKRTYPANTLVIGKSFYLLGGGTYVTPATNTLSADIVIKVGSSAVMSVTTPAAPATTSPQGVDFHALCTVRTSTTINCQGRFSFVLIGVGLSADVAFNQTNTFVPGVSNVVDVTGDWNGTTTTHSTTVTEAMLMALN